MSSVRVSKVAVLAKLKEYLADELATDIYWAICDADEKDRRDMIGMTCAEWSERFDDDWEIVWADDTHAGFGKRGDSVYGCINDCIICRTDYDGHRYKLWVWCEALSSEDRTVRGGMKAYYQRHPAAEPVKV